MLRSWHCPRFLSHVDAGSLHVRTKLLALLAAFYITAEGAIAQDDDQLVDPPRSEIRPGVVFSPEAALVVMMRPEGGSEAVRIDSGETLWDTAAADKPLIATRGRLLAQTESGESLLLLTMLELETGEVVGRAEAELPRGVVALIDDELERSFSVEARAAEDGILVHWRERFQPVAAVAHLQQEAEITEGVIRVDLDAQSAEPVEIEEFRQLFADPPPDLSDNERLREIDGVQFRSAGGNAVLTTEPIADDRRWDKYVWSVWDRAGGELIGRFTDFQRLNNFAVLDTFLLQEVPPHVRLVEQQPISTPLSIRAVDLSDGAEIWQRQIRDTTYRGPMPP